LIGKNNPVMGIITDHAADKYYFFSFLPAKGRNTMFKMSMKAAPNNVYHYIKIA